MSYTKVGWKDYPSTDTPVNASNLNRMDTQIATNEANIGDVTANSEFGSDVSAQISGLVSNLGFSKVEKATQTVTIAKGSNYVDTTYTFTNTYSDTPFVMVCGNTGSTDIKNVPNPVVYSLDTSSVTIRVWRNINETTSTAAPKINILVLGS